MQRHIEERLTNLATALRVRLARLYPDRDVTAIAGRIVARARAAAGAIPANRPERWSERDLLLITYGDNIRHAEAHPLAALHEFLATHLRESVGVVHVLPFFPYSSDDGFSVIDYRRVDPVLGDWADIRRIAEDFDMMFDLVLNHVSRASRWFLDYLAGDGPARDWFLEMDPDGDFSAVVRPRNSPVLTEVETRGGRRHVWTTFSDDQIDLDFANPDVLVEMIDVALFYLVQGARYLRLDAVAFVWKRMGTGCVHLPETHEIVKILREVAECVRPDVVLLTETNVPHKENLAYFGDGDEAHMVYQFALPPLVLHALHSGDGHWLTEWAQGLPDLPDGNSFLNFTASHDGIGLRPVDGLLPAREVEDLVAAVQRQGGHLTMRTSREGIEKPYELNITWFDALSQTRRGEPEWAVQRFLCSQSIPLVLRGVPAVYIHSLMATPNDMVGFGLTGRVRSVNRRKWEADELIALLNDRRWLSSR